MRFDLISYLNFRSPTHEVREHFTVHAGGTNFSPPHRAVAVHIPLLSGGTKWGNFSEESNHSVAPVVWSFRFFSLAVHWPVAAGR